MASMAEAMAWSSAADRGGKPPDGGHALTRERTHRDILPSALQSPTRDRARDDVSPLVSTTVIDDAALMQELEIGSPSLEIQKKVANFLAQSEPPVAQEETGQHEAQADAPPADQNLIALINKSRADHAVVLTLLHDGEFADHIQGSKTDRIHAQGQGQIRTEIVTTIVNKT